LFDPAGVTVVAAPAAAPGHWAGAPSALATPERILLAYRLRAPRPARGYALRIAASDDGRTFRDVWSARKEEIGSPSLERACLAAVPSGVRLYVSSVDPADGRWRIDVIEADRAEHLDVASRQPALTAAAAGVESVKDPVVIRDGGRWLMFASFGSRALRAAPGRDDVLHASGDALSTGQLLSCTGLATSDEGLAWRWEGPALVPTGHGWDGFETRISAVVRRGAGWLALYDGIATIDDNYEERTGIATSSDLRRWERETVDGAALRSPHGSGSLRYACLVRAGGRTLAYFELARADGAHDLACAEAQISA
jgi:hypothetical protein